MRAAFQEALLSSPGGRIAGGTDEILKNIIAERVLGLPAGRARGPRGALRPASLQPALRSRLHSTARPPGLVRALKTVFLILGAGLLGVLVYRVGAGPILETLGRLAWWQFVLICLPYALVMAADTLGWRFAFARDRAPFWRLYGARLVGEALNVVTAVGAGRRRGGEGVARAARRELRGERAIGRHRQDDDHDGAGPLPPDRPRAGLERAAVRLRHPPRDAVAAPDRGARGRRLLRRPGLRPRARGAAGS